MDGLGGVLCRCTGYRKIVAAVLDAAGDAPQPLSTPPPGAAVGARLAKLDGVPKLTGAERYGADAVPADAHSGSGSSDRPMNLRESCSAISRQQPARGPA